MTSNKQYRSCLVAALISVCAASSLNALAAPKNVEIWIHPGHAIGLEPVIANYNASQSEIHVTIVPKEPTPEVIVAGFAAGTLPEIMWSAHSFTPALAAKGILVDLLPYVRRDGMLNQIQRDAYPGALATGNSYKGLLFSIPVMVQLEGVWYNPGLLEEAGLGAPQRGWTWDDLQEMARKAHRVRPDGEPETLGLVSGNAAALPEMFILQAGGKLWDAEDRVVINSAAGRAAYRRIVELINLGVLRMVGAHSIGDAAMQSFRTALRADGNYRADFFKANKSPMRVAPALRMDRNATPVTALSNRSFAILKTTPERQELAWRVVKHLMQADLLGQFMANLGYLPSTRSAVQSKAFRALTEADPNLAAWAFEVLPYGQGEGVTGTPYTATAWSQAWFPLQTQLFKGELPVTAFLEELERRLTSIIRDWAREQ